MYLARARHQAPCTTFSLTRRCPGTRPECRLSRRGRPWCPGTSCHTSSAQWPSSWQSPSPPWSTRTRGYLGFIICYTVTPLDRSEEWGWGLLKYLEHIPPRKKMRGKIQQRRPHLGSWWWPKPSRNVLSQWNCGRIDIIIYDKLNNEPRDLTSFQFLNGIFATIIVS